MFFNDPYVFIVCFWEFDRRAELLLLPEDRDAASNRDVWEDHVMADKDLLGLDVIGGIEIDIDSTTAKASAWHEFASSTDDTVVEGKVFVLGIDLLDMPLNYRDSPARGEIVVCEDEQEVLIPEVLALGRLAL